MVEDDHVSSLFSFLVLSCSNFRIDTPNLKYLNLWENYGIIQVTTGLQDLETLVLSRTSVTKLSCDLVLDEKTNNFPSLKKLYISCIDVNSRTISAWSKRRPSVEVLVEANVDFFNEYLLYLDDFDDLPLFHEEQKY